MDIVIGWLETFFTNIHLPLLEVWGRFSYLLGFALMIFAFGGFTFRQGNHWKLGREKQTWDSKALQAMILTLALVVSTGYFGSFIVLVPGAQTFESLKDLLAFLPITSQNFFKDSHKAIARSLNLMVALV